MCLSKKFSMMIGMMLLLAMAACGRDVAGQIAPTPTPLVLTFAKISQPEPLQLPQGGSFTLKGYAAEDIAIADPQVLQVISPTVAPSEYSAPETTLLATTMGSTQVTITQTLCEGVSSCNGPAFFFNLQVEVQ